MLKLIAMSKKGLRDDENLCAVRIRSGVGSREKGEAEEGRLESTEEIDRLC